MRIILILTLLIMVSCNNHKTDNKNTETYEKDSIDTVLRDSNKADDPCKELSYLAEYTNDFKVKSKYYKCEPEWKMNLKFYHFDSLIYEITDLREYHFDSTSLFFSIKEGEGIYKLLIERDDRPFRNQVDVFTFKNDKLMELDTIPNFEIRGDFDNDGVTEFGGPLNTLEAIHQDSVTYNPFLMYEINDTLFRLDTILTEQINKDVYGGFWGFNYNYKIQINRDKITWP